MTGLLRHGWRRAAVAIVAAAVAVALIALAPHVLRRMESFRVTRVEVVGTRYLAPHRALEVSGITLEDNVFDDPTRWRRAVERLPVVERVRIDRRMPGTIVLRITETRPVAWIRTPELRMITADGRVLSLDPAGVPTDLPVLSLPASAAVNDGVLTESAMEMIRLWVQLRNAEPRLAARISEVRAAGPAVVRVILRDPEGVQMLLPLDIAPDRLRAARLTLADLRQRDQIGERTLVDLRFSGQIVVSLGLNRTG